MNIIIRLLTLLCPTKRGRRRLRAHIKRRHDVLVNYLQSTENPGKRHVIFPRKIVRGSLFASSRLKHLHRGDEEIQSNASIYDLSLQNEKVFLQWIKGKSIAVVGSSPCEKGKGNGPLIDSHDIVIRFNNYITSGFEPDYGQKTDVWARNTNDFESTFLRSTNGYNFVILRGDLYRGKMNRDVRLLCKSLMNENTPFFIMKDIMLELAKKVNNGSPSPLPSVGLSIIYYFYTYGDFKRINCYGFSFTDQLTNPANRHYYKADNRTNIYHSWKNEKDFFKRMLTGDPV